MTPSDVALRALRSPDQRNQGRAETETGRAMVDRLAALEACAMTVRAWNPSIIPGLLQTSRYAAGAIKTGYPSLSAEEIHTLACARAERIAAFLSR
jgi:hypothetical protein